MNDVSVKCCWCHAAMNLGERCASEDCRAQSDRMRAAAESLDASFKRFPLGLLDRPQGIWNLSQRRLMDEAEAMSRDN
jgi:hypothetical protein